MFAKIIKNLFVYIEVIARRIWDDFWGHGVDVFVVAFIRHVSSEVSAGTARSIIISSRRRLPTDVQSRPCDDKTRQRDTWRLQVRLAYCRRITPTPTASFNGDRGWKGDRRVRRKAGRE